MSNPAAKPTLRVTGDGLTRFNQLKPLTNVAFSALFILLALITFLPVVFVFIISISSEASIAQYNAAICYHYGKGTEVDMDKALHYYRLSAEGGHSAAQFNLGVCCADGIGMSPNPAEAVRWYTKAAEAGYYKAQVNLAYCYQHGIGVPADIDTALYWYDMAEKQGE